MRLFLGIDGGQSGTKALIADETGEILGRGRAGPCNHVSSAEAREKLARVVRQCVETACTDAALTLPIRFDAACFGMSGGPSDKEEVLRKVVDANQYVFTDDAAIALSGALAGEPGVITIAGTGSIALGKGADNVLRRAGGWGYVFGDEGGAFDIVRQSLRACLRAEEHWGPDTELRAVFLSRTGCRNINEVLHLFYTPPWSRSQVALLAPLVHESAAEGDAVALSVIETAADKLAEFAKAVRRQAWDDRASVACSYVGGVFRSDLVLEHYRSLLKEASFIVDAPKLGPAAGALIEAYRVTGTESYFTKLLSSKFRHE